MHKLFRIILIINLLLIIDLHQLNAEILVGVSAPLSGDVGEYGNAVRNGIELARKENLENKNVKFFFEDNKFSASATISVFNKLVNYNKVQLIYNWGEMPLQAVAPIAEQRKIPIVAMSLDPEPILDKKYIIGSINHSTQFAKLVTDYL
ncbi:MAG: ABC transporter substrate-binding protein [Bdellovibrionota bacterium]